MIDTKVFDDRVKYVFNQNPIFIKNVTLNSNRNMLRKPNIMRNKTEQICLIISHTKLNTINCI